MSQPKAALVGLLVVIIMLCVVMGTGYGLGVSLIIAPFVLLYLPVFVLLVNMRYTLFSPEDTSLHAPETAPKRFLDSRPSLLRILLCAHAPVIFLLMLEMRKCLFSPQCPIIDAHLPALALPLLIANVFGFTFWLCIRKRAKT